MISEFKYGQTWKIWVSLFSLSLYNTFKLNNLRQMGLIIFQRGFRIVITWKTRNISFLFPSKDKNYYMCYLLKEIALMVHVALVKPSLVQKLDGLNIIQLKVQNHWNTFETVSSTVLHGLLFQCSKRQTRKEELREIIYIETWSQRTKELWKTG